jgi:uncharacterized protein involved in outer membrane biogenesis
MKLGKLVVGLVGLVIILPLAILAVFFLTFDTNHYKAEISRVLTEQTGRTIALAGDVGLGLTSNGLTLTIKDASIGNPEWASRKNMANIGELSLTVALKPLLEQQLKIERVWLNKADIALETNAKGQSNWDIAFKGANTAPTKETKTSAGGGNAKPPIEIIYAVEHVGLRDSSISFADGKQPPTKVQINKLAARAADKINVSADGTLGGQSFQVTLAGAGVSELLAMKNWPFELQLDYQNVGLKTDAALKQFGKIIELKSYDVALPQGRLQGEATITTGSARPKVSGTLNSARFDTTVAASSTPSNNVAAAPAATRVFSEQPFDLSALQLVDAKLAVSIGELVLQPHSLKDVQTQVSLTNGNLQLRPLSFKFVNQPLAGGVGVIANKPAQISLDLQGQNIDTNALLAAFHADKLAVGAANFALDVRGSGNTPAAVAGSLNGQMTLEVGKGPPASATRKSLGSLIGEFVPAAGLLGEADFMCLATKLVAQNGVLSSQGFLLDTNLATVGGVGAINLASEQIDMTFKPQAKDAKAELITLPIKASGTLAKPRFVIEKTGAVQKLASTLLGGNLVGVNDMLVPMVPASTTAQNGCVQALANPVYAKPAQQQPALLGKPVDKLKTKAQEEIQRYGNKAGAEIDKAIGSEAGQQLKNQLEQGLGIKLFGSQNTPPPAASPAAPETAPPLSP